MSGLKRRLFGYGKAGVQTALSERDAALDVASKNASAAERRAERLSSELAETQGRLAGLEEQLDAARELSASLTADLERSVAERGSIEAEAHSLRRELEELREKIDVTANVSGGGVAGQAGAVAHGIARALQKMNTELRPKLKQAGHIKRDPREKERKKAGQPGARKRFQFSKR